MSMTPARLGASSTCAVATPGMPASETRTPHSAHLRTLMVSSLSFPTSSTEIRRGSALLHQSLLHNRLHHRVLEFGAHFPDGCLRHHDGNNVLFGIDPEMCAVDTAPAEAAIRNSDFTGEGILDNANGESEGFARITPWQCVRNMD